MAPIARIALAALVGLAGLALTGCRQDMHDQAKYEPLEASPLFADGAASRAPVAGTVARGFLREDDARYRGVDAEGQLVERLPLEVTRPLLERGRDRYDNFCAPCHDRIGDGRGMIVRRGYKQPPSLHEERLRQVAIGYFYAVMTDGFGQMASYAAQLTPEDRWAVAAYVRTLQLSRRITRAELSDDDLARLADAAQAAKAAEAAAAAEPPAGGEEGP